MLLRSRLWLRCNLRGSESASIRHHCSLRIATPVQFRPVHARGSMATSATLQGLESQACSAQENELWSNITVAYRRAQESGAAYMTDTQGEVLNDAAMGVDFVVRVSTALRHKPTEDKPKGPKPAFRNPFLPYEEALWVQHLTPTHTLLLNKFNVAAHHLLVVTREFAPQEAGLDAGDLEATWMVLKGMQPAGLAFFNCGPQSGASQPHKHVQIVPLPFAPLEGLYPPTFPLAAQSPDQHPPLEPFEARGLPCQAFACTLPEEVSAEQVHEVSKQLQGRCLGIQQGGADEESYNVLLSQSMMMYIPRRSGSAGPCSLNALAFAGTLLVRFEEELQYVRANGPASLLAGAGYPWQ